MRKLFSFALAFLLFATPVMAEDYILDEEDEDEDYDDDLFDDEDFEDEDFEEGFDFGDEDTTIYEVECACGEIINFDEETLESGSMKCPNCGELLEFSLEDDEDDELAF